MSFFKVDEISIRYNGIHPSITTQQQIESTVKELFEEAPYGAVIHTSFTDRKGSVKGILQINSCAGHFFASAESHDLNEVLTSMIKQIRKRLKKWKEKRFKQDRELGPSIAS